MFTGRLVDSEVGTSSLCCLLFPTRVIDFMIVFEFILLNDCSLCIIIRVIMLIFNCRDQKFDIIIHSLIYVK